MLNWFLTVMYLPDVERPPAGLCVLGHPNRDHRPPRRSRRRTPLCPSRLARRNVAALGVLLRLTVPTAVPGGILLLVLPRIAPPTG